MTPTDFIQKRECTKEQFKFGQEWQAEGRPIDHPFVWSLMEAYAKKTNYGTKN